MTGIAHHTREPHSAWRRRSTRLSVPKCLLGSLCAYCAALWPVILKLPVNWSVLSLCAWVSRKIERHEPNIDAHCSKAIRRACASWQRELGGAFKQVVIVFILPAAFGWQIDRGPSDKSPALIRTNTRLHTNTSIARRPPHVLQIRLSVDI